MSKKQKHQAHATAKRLDVQAWLFFGLLAVLALLLFWRVWQIKGIYLNKDIRTATELTLVRLQNQEGWLISDMQLLTVTPDVITIMHRWHGRGTDPRQCIEASTTLPKMRRCDDGR
jgi:hypothetical protein